MVDRSVTASANVDLVVAMVKAYNAGEIDAMLEFYAPDQETLPDASVFPESRPLHGRDEFRSWIEGINSAWIDPRWETTEVRAVAGGRVLHRGEWGGIGAASGISTTSSITGLFAIRAGQIAGAVYYFDHDRALKAAGFAAQADDLPAGQGRNSQLMLQVFLPDGRMDREAATALLDEEVVWDTSRSPFPDTGVFRGVEGVRSWFEGLDKAFGDVTYERESSCARPATGSRCCSTFEAAAPPAGSRS